MTTFSLFWMLNQLAPSSLDVGVGLLSGPDRMEADIDWMDGTTSRVVMNLDYAIEHVYHTPGVYTISVTAVADGTVQMLTVYPGQMILTVTPVGGNPMAAQLLTSGATGNMTVDWGDITTSNVTGDNLNAGLVNHTYTTPAVWSILITPVGWPSVNGPLAKSAFTASSTPTLTGVTPQAVLVGGTITVHGTNLGSSQHLFVGGTDCLVPGWQEAPTTIVTSVPSYAAGLVGKGPQDVTVITAAGAATLPHALAITG